MCKHWNNYRVMQFNPRMFIFELTDMKLVCIFQWCSICSTEMYHSILFFVAKALLLINCADVIYIAIFYFQLCNIINLIYE